MRNSIIKNIAYTFLFIAIGGCQVSERDEDLEAALLCAGENRHELEKVLEHYSDDAEKLAAAKFLILNMPGHYSYADTNAVMAYSREVDSIVNAMRDRPHSEIRDSINQCAIRHGIQNLPTIQDCEIITADYLIRNIDEAFRSWKEGRWARHLTFDDFCEYLLPYKVEELQLLDDWRIRLKDYYTERLHDLALCDVLKNSAYEACRQVNYSLHDSLRPNHGTQLDCPFMPVEILAKVPFGSCDDYAVLASTVFWSLGIPVVRDFTPQWAFRSQGHSWNVVLHSDGRRLPFSGVCTVPGEPHNLNEKMPKAYRHTYAANKELQQLNQEANFIPPLFQNVFMRDVTADYIACRDVAVQLSEKTSGYVYLSVFNDKEWVPVAYCKAKGRKATFQKMGLNTVYLPVRYDDKGRQQILGSPFILHYDGSMEPIEADTTCTVEVTLHRKYPVLEYVAGILTRLRDGEFQASNDKSFGQHYLVHKITDCRAYGFDIAVSDTIPPCRYWRYYTNREGAFCNMAEIKFYESDDTTTAIHGSIFGTEGAWFGDTTKTRKAVFDGNILTFFDAPSFNESWVGMDFGRPVKLSHFYYVGRGDGNSIEPGDQYELLYWQDNRWKTLGRKTPDRPWLVWEDVPKRALLLLRDRTKGQNERIFTYEKGEQVWW